MAAIRSCTGASSAARMITILLGSRTRRPPTPHRGGKTLATPPPLAPGGAVSGIGNLAEEAASDPQELSPSHPHNGWGDNAAQQEVLPNKLGLRVAVH